MKLQQDKYPVFFERNGDKVIMDWASGNIGYAILGMAASPEGVAKYLTENISNL